MSLLHNAVTSYPIPSVHLSHHHHFERGQKDTLRCVSVSVKRRSERAFPKPYWRLWCALQTYNHHLTGREYHQTFHCTTHGSSSSKVNYPRVVLVQCQGEFGDQSWLSCKFAQVRLVASKIELCSCPGRPPCTSDHCMSLI